MKKLLENPEENTPAENLPLHADTFIEQLHNEALMGESYEAANQALSDVEALQQFRARLKQRPFGSFYDIFEDITIINSSPISIKQKEKQIMRAVDAMGERTSRFSPRVADIYAAVLARISTQAYQPKFEATKEKMAELNVSGDLDVLIADGISWDLKLNRLEMRVDGFLAGARALDKRDGNVMDDDQRKIRQEKIDKINKSSHTPPQRSNESKPSMDEMDRLKEGERVPAIWSIAPAYGGYYREQSFSDWDSKRNVWVEPRYEYRDVAATPLCEKEDREKGLLNITMHATIAAGRWTSLPLPYTHGVHSIEAGGANHHLQQDQNGDIVIMVAGDGDVEVRVIAAPNPDKRYGPRDRTKIAVPTMPAKFSEETKTAITKIKEVNQGSIARAHALESYTENRLKYSNESKYNTLYDTNEKGYFAAIDEYKKADCDVGNTYFAALCAQLNIPVRHVVGHSVRGKNEIGAATINSGTGHGWSEVWDDQENKWVRIDATPPGDSNLEDQQGASGVHIPGDYGEQEAHRPSDEKIEALRKKLAEHKEELSYTREERQLAEASGVELKEARQIVKEINEAERTLLPSGDPVVDVMATLWDAISESRKRKQPAFSGPVRRSEKGEQITDMVRHYIGIQAGETDPASRERSVTEIKEEKLPSGMDVYVVGDKSGSMFVSSNNKGELLWVTQRRFEYMLFSSLYRFNCDLGKAHLPVDNALDVRTMAISFRGNTAKEIDIDKPLSSRFTAEDKVKMWHSVSTAGSGNGDVEAMRVLYQKIKEEKEQLLEQGIVDKRVRVVVAYSDGGYVGAESQMRDLAEAMSQLNVVVVGIGLTESAASVPVVMQNPPHSFGEVISNMEELIAATAKHIVLQAVKLFPEKARQNAEQLIGEVLHKFGIIK